MELLALLVIGSSLVLCAALVPFTTPLAHALGAIDHPGPRKHHPAPTPRLGGIALAVSFVLVVLAGFFLAPRLSAAGWPALQAPLAMLREAPRVASKLMAVLAGATLCFVVGALDDVLGPRFPLVAKAAGQLLAACVVAAGGVRMSFLPYEWMNVALTVVWLVGITNAFNLLDNMDGLCRGGRLRGVPGVPAQRVAAGRAVHRAPAGGLHGQPGWGSSSTTRRPPVCSWGTAAASSSAAPWLR